ncbi:MAG: ABC transporter ATP-binding protein/permease [Oscillospiraceae bacterium]|nr:ABC transporter ATP-binding protein/permease [Oscillospiraceae bacterium]
MPQLVRYVVDSVIGGEVSGIPLIGSVVALLGGPDYLRGRLYLVGLVLLGVAITGGVCQFVYRRSLAKGAEGMIRRLRANAFSHIQRLPFSWHLGIQTGDIIQRCTSDVDVVRNFAANQLLEMVHTILLVVVAYTLLFPMNFVMAMSSIVFLPLIFFYSFFYLSRIAARFKAADEAEGQLLSIAQENFTGVRVVRAFGRERHEVERFDSQNRHYTGLWIRLGDTLSVFWGLGDLIAGLQMVVICAVGVHQAMHGGITVGGFMVFLTYNAMTIWPVRGLGRILSEASKARVSLTRIGEILNAEPESDPENAVCSLVSGSVGFNGVNFSYGDRQVLRDVSFTVESGTTLGIIGETGSGKSTIAALLCRLYDLKDGEGEITVGGVNVNDYSRRSLRRGIGVVMQEPFLYSRSLRENIAAFSDEYSLDEIREAAAIACVDDDIMGFQNQYDTIVGERGVTLSGGQKQRVAIARAILPGPPVIIFDDSLSAVDTETDTKIREELSRRTAGTTAIIIAHRVTSISRADKVIVMGEGEIIEMGAPADLMQKENGVYRRIHDMQESIAEGDEELVRA